LGHRAGWQDEYKGKRQEINTIVDSSVGGGKKKTDTAALESIHREQEKENVQLFTQLAAIMWLCVLPRALAHARMCVYTF
jgi:hypothetical protein